jgi:hypothetical protein
MIISLLVVSVSSVALSAPAQASPGVIRFRLLAVERHFDHTRLSDGEDLIRTLLNFQNWDNSTTKYVSYIHLLSVADEDDIGADVRPFYRGDATRANLQDEIENFLSQSVDEEVVILYYAGHSGWSQLSMDFAVTEADLDSWMSSIDADAYVNVILETCHSGYWTNDGVGPNILDHADNILAACEHAQSAYCWGTWTAFSDVGIRPAMGAATTDTNSDGWASLSEIFDVAAPACTAHVTGKDPNLHQDPVSWYGACTGNIPIVQQDATAPYPDSTAPDTDPVIGTPQYSSGGDLYIGPTTSIGFVAEDLGCPTSGVEFTKYRIDGGSWITYTASFTLAAYSDGSHTVDYYSQDNNENEETPESLTVILDSTPPTTTLSIGTPKYVDGGDTYVTSATTFTLTATDAVSGVDYTEYKIDDGSWTTYTAPFTISNSYSDGPHTIYYRSADNVGNLEPANSEAVILDNSPPEVDVISPPDGSYVYGIITIQIDATDAGSGVDYVEFSLDGGSTWDPTVYDTYYETDWDTSLSSEGTYTIDARAFDNLGNMGVDEEPPEATAVHLELSTSFSDSDFNPIEGFDVIFSAQKPPTYKISTNPGTLYEIIEITNTGSTVTLPDLILDVTIPIEADFLGPGAPAFELQGAKPVHIYLDGAEVTPKGKWMPDLSNLEVGQDLAPGDTITLTIHYEYAFKGEQYSASEIGGWLGEDYDFETDIISAIGPSWTETLVATAVMN